MGARHVSIVGGDCERRADQNRLWLLAITQTAPELRTHIASLSGFLAAEQSQRIPLGPALDDLRVRPGTRAHRRWFSEAANRHPLLGTAIHFALPTEHVPLTSTPSPPPIRAFYHSHHAPP